MAEPTDVEPEEGDQQDKLADLRAAADRGKQAREEADRLSRENAFLKAGIDTESGVGKLLFDGYKGDPTKDAVLAAAKEYGILPGESQQEQQRQQVQLTDDELAMSRERAALATGAEPPGQPGTPDPKDEAMRLFREGRDKGQRLEDAAASYFDHLFAAAYTGDKRAQHDPAAFAEGAGDY